MKNISDAQIEGLEVLAQRPHLLWANVDRGGKCWPWTGSVNQDGYGAVRVGPTSVLAHRAAHFLGVGSLSALCVCHECDTPNCCNPSHLFLSTHLENMRDMKAKGRRLGVNTGVANGRAKLTYASVTAIRNRRLDGAQLRELAAAYGVGLSTISRVCRGENWT